MKSIGIDVAKKTLLLRILLRLDSLSQNSPTIQRESKNLLIHLHKMILIAFLRQPELIAA